MQNNNMRHNIFSRVSDRGDTSNSLLCMERPWAKKSGTVMEGRVLNQSTQSVDEAFVKAPLNLACTQNWICLSALNHHLC